MYFSLLSFATPLESITAYYQVAAYKSQDSYSFDFFLLFYKLLEFKSFHIIKEKNKRG